MTDVEKTLYLMRGYIRLWAELTDNALPKMPLDRAGIIQCGIKDGHDDGVQRRLRIQRHSGTAGVGRELQRTPDPRCTPPLFRSRSGS